MDNLSLPGDIPGLLRRGSPGICKNLTSQDVPCVVVSVGNARASVAVRQEWPGYFAGGETLVEDYSLDRALAEIALNLSDATGRAHAAWWVAEQIGANPSAGTTWHVYGGGVGWSLTVARGAYWFVAEFGGGAMKVQILGGLDPNDPRLLPDGSRHVDALALRRVVLHLAGRAP